MQHTNFSVIRYANFNLLILTSALFIMMYTGVVVARDNADWPLHGLDYGNSRFSLLNQVNKTNVSKLELAWKVHTGKIDSFQTSPIVVEGMMFVTTPFNDVLALNADTGIERWRYRHILRTKEFCCGPVNRGVGVGDGKVFMATIDNRLLALRQKDGKVIWDIDITNSDPMVREAIAPILGNSAFKGADVKGGTGYGANMAPQVFDGKVFVGITGAGYGLHLDQADKGDANLSIVGFSGGDNGLRGFMAAFDTATGKELWRWYSVKDETWVGKFSATTPGGVYLNRNLDQEWINAKKWTNTWRIGGGSIWSTPAIDTGRRLLYFGTGNPAPPMDDQTRPGDNLYTSSIIALNLDTGKLVWSFQTVPHDRWGYDVASPPVLTHVAQEKKKVPAVAVAGKTGWVYFLDRETGKLLFKSEPFVPQRNLFATPTEEGVEIAPAILGGASWSPSAWDELTSTYFVEGVHHPATYYMKPLTAKPGQPWTSYSYMDFSQKERGGTLSAIDGNTGHIRWQYKTGQPLVGGVLATAGGLVFAGEGDGMFDAFDAETGKLLWTYKALAGVNAPPITYMLNDIQYIAVAAGGNWQFNFNTGDEILVFRVVE